MRRPASKTKVIPKRGMPLLPRSLAQFKLEVTALLMVGHRWSEKRSRAAVKRWSRYVAKRWKQGKPPCAVADHISRWDHEKAVCPCHRKRRCPGGKGGRRSKRKGTSRDADNPKEGEIYESKRGNRWRVSNVDGERVYVESAGRKAPGRLQWSRSNLKGMREVDGEKPRQLSLFGNDPNPRRGRKSGGRSRRKVGTVVQTILFPKRRFTVAKAKMWAKKHGYRYGKVDTTKNYHRLRQLDPKKVKVRATITISKDILAIIGTPR